MKELFIAWLISIMSILAPLDKKHVVPEAMETPEQTQERYEQIAQAIYEGAYDESVPPVFMGKKARAQTALLVVTVFYTETGLRRDMDLGTSRDRLRPEGLNDYGRSWCMGQLNIGRRVVNGEETSVRTTVEGWTGPELYADRRKCVVATINALRRSKGACQRLPISEQLAVYAAGNCVWTAGKVASRVKMNMFFRLWGTHGTVPAEDDILQLEQAPSTVASNP